MFQKDEINITTITKNQLEAKLKRAIGNKLGLKITVPGWTSSGIRIEAVNRRNGKKQTRMVLFNTKFKKNKREKRKLKQLSMEGTIEHPLQMGFVADMIYSYVSIAGATTAEKLHFSGDDYSEVTL